MKKIVSGIGIACLSLVASGLMAFAQGRQCQLVGEDSRVVTGCKVIVGHSGGQRVGEFRIAEGFERKDVGMTEACKLDARYHAELGTIISPDKVRIGKRIFVLSGDCKDSTVQ